MCFRSAANDPVAVATNPQSKPAKRLDLDPLYRGDLKKHTFLYVTADGNQTALFGCDTISPNHNNEKNIKTRRRSARCNPVTSCVSFVLVSFPSTSAGRLESTIYANLEY
ncbi:hypothetical protein EVAR_93589_1 [Eumeta japonica]|uniref:Uncharacterized protein n=1 Tax=Eumeta variegata TaxID=151549 RepID=A0A4C1TQF3_EUMVA|nr:hypothetical protein EVAR_93589_1 [Eumeta japonica]